MFADISGSHFNPVVSLISYFSKSITQKQLCLYIIAQILGAIAGVILTHAMFGQSLFQLSTHDRGDFRFFLSEIIATFGLISVVFFVKSESKIAAISMYITAAYWCTSSTSFANPAVTIARSLTNTFSGIELQGVPGFLTAQILGAVLAYLFVRTFRS